MKTDIKKMLASKTKQALSSNILSADSIRQNIVILDELKNLIPALAQEELEQLENNIVQHGCQTPLQLWQTPKQNVGVVSENSDDIAYVLIDGHNRLTICKKNSLPFEVYMLSFASLKEAKDYMINLQLGRRNLSLSQISYFRGLRYNNEKSEKSENLKQISPKGQNDPSVKTGENSPENDINLPKGHFDPSVKNEENDLIETVIFPKGQNDPSGNSTAERLSKEYKVSPKTIKRDAEFAKGLEKLDIDFRNDVLNGKTKVDKGLIQKVAKVEELESLIIDINQLNEIVNNQVVFDYAETNATKSLLKEKATEIVNISKKFAKTNRKTDLQNIIELAQKTLALME
jgi:hypothetical protein